VKIAYFDCFSGVSGDMCLGALVDLGLPLADLSKGLRGLGCSGFTLRPRRVVRSGVSATKVDVIIDKGKDRPLAYAQIRRLLTSARLPRKVRERSLAVFQRLAQAEASVHRSSVKTVHFHELGILDSLVDIVGTVLGCHLLGLEHLYCSSINVGSGMVKTDHGLLPVPPPATAKLLEGWPIHAAGPARELTTPTGAALMATLGCATGSLPAMTLTQVGHGAGSFNPPDWPNALRVLVGESISGSEADRIMVLETNLDDMNPQAYELLMERLMGQGALDVTLTPVIMKRGRPGIVLTVLVDPAKVESVMRVVFAETTTLGVRVQEISRRVLPREMMEVPTKFGPVRVKVARAPGGGAVLKTQPEYRDCKRLAEQTGLPLRTIMQEVHRGVRRLQW
jgi:uncharacterized protein (TIGR00299 family) protein